MLIYNVYIYKLILPIFITCRFLKIIILLILSIMICMITDKFVHVRLIITKTTCFIFFFCLFCIDLNKFFFLYSPINNYSPSLLLKKKKRRKINKLFIYIIILSRTAQLSCIFQIFSP